MNSLTDMKVTAIAPWFGSKRTLAPRIVEELGEHRAYWEPFCGSMAVLLGKPESSFETVNDLHGDLVNLARVIKHSELGPKLYRQMRRWMMSEALFNDAAEQYRARQNVPAPEEPDLERAANYFICAWFGRNGVAGTQSYNQGFCRRFTKNGGHAATRWRSACNSIPAWRRRMRNVTILSADGIGLIERIEDAAGVVIYADPPYLVKGAKYVHDFADGFMSAANDHERLATALGRFKKTRVVVSYYEHPALASLYRGWTKREVYTTKAMVSSGQRDVRGQAAVAPEVLLINGKSHAQKAA